MDTDSDTDIKTYDNINDAFSDMTTDGTIRASNTEETNPGTSTTVVTVTGSTTTSTISGGDGGDGADGGATEDPTAPATVTVYQPSPTAGEDSDGAENVNSDANTGGLSTGAKAGIGVGVACAVILLIAVALFLFFRRRKRRGGGKTGKGSETTSGSEAGNDRGAGAGVSPAEIEGRERRVFELPGGRDRPELEGEGRREKERYELDG